MGGRPKVYDDVDALLKQESVSRWLRGLKEGSGRTTALYHFARYLRWARESGFVADPDRIVAECMDGTNRTLVEHLKRLHDYCSTGKDLEGDLPATRQRVYRSVRSWYDANYVSLPRSALKVPAEKSSSNHVRKEVTAMEFLGMVKKVLASAKLSARDKSIILTVLQGGFDDSTLAEAFNYVAFPQLAKWFGTQDYKTWDVSKCPVQVWVNRPKTDYRYYSFVDVDALEALKEHLEVREREFGKVAVHRPRNPGDLPTSDPVFLNQHGRPIRPSDVWHVFNDAGKRAGINVKGSTRSPYKGASIRYPFRSHECRDTMVTLAKRVGADVVAPNFFVGHSIDRLKYDKSPQDDPGYYRDEYLKLARPWLNPLSGKSLEVEKKLTAKFEERLSALEEKIEAALNRSRGAPS